MSEEDDLKPWEQQPGEPLLWYERFEHFRLQGARRTRAATFNWYRESKGMPPTRQLPDSWTNRMREWRWGERANAWDREQTKIRLEMWEQEKEQDRNDRILLLKAARSAVSKALPKLDLTNSSPSTVIYALGMLVNELRKEYQGEGPEDSSTKSGLGAIEALGIREVVIEHSTPDDADEEEADGS